MRRLLISATLIQLTAALASAGVVVTRGDVDVASLGSSGRQGSTTGAISDNPGLISGTTGLVDLDSLVVAGPVSAGELPTTPGTTGVVTTQSRSTIDFVPTGSELVIDFGALSATNIVNMDGGGYLGDSSASIEIRFVLDANTNYTLQGDVAFDDDDGPAYLIIGGGTVGNFVLRFGPAGNGPIDLSGVLTPGEYRISLGQRVFEVPQPGENFGDFSEAGACGGRFVLNPNAPFAAGDMNCDGFITVGDIGGFVLALTDPAGYGAAFPSCDIDLADVNHDGFVTVGDISAFVALLVG